MSADGGVFVSYAREDSAYVKRLVTSLARAGVTVWADDEIPTGERWERALRERIEACASLLVVMSPAAAASAWVAKEVRYAQRLGKQILPVLLEGRVILNLKDVQFEDVTGGVMPSPAFVARLLGLAALRRVVRHQVGLVPEAAECYQHRGVADQLDAALAATGTAILTGVSAQILSGLGGVGKTQLAASLARRLRDQGDLDVLTWFTASGQDAVVTGYAQAGSEITGADSTDPTVAATAFLAWLAATTGRWLVVLDDLADPRDLDRWWPPRTPTGRVVVTTRRRDAALASHGALIKVGLYTPAEAHAYLAVKLADRPARLLDADELAADLGYLPVALAQAATFVADRDITCADYRTRFADRRRALDELAPDTLPDDYTRPIGVTLSLSVEVANQLDPAGLARPLLVALALLDPNGVPAELVTTPAMLDYLTGYRDPRLETEPPVDAERARDALACLVRLNLVDTTSNGHWYRVRVHALVQRATREQTTPGWVDAAVDAAAQGLLECWPEVERDTSLGQTLRTNTEALRQHGEDRLWQADAHALLFRTGRSLGAAGLVDAAVGHFQRLTAAAVARLGPDHPHTLRARSSLANWQGQAGDPAGAAAAFEALLADYVRVLGPDHSDTLATRGNLANWQGVAGDPAGAAAVFEALLADAQRLFGPIGFVGGVIGPDRPGTLTARQNLAFWRGQAGDLAGAAAAFEALLADYLRVLGPDHSDTLTTRGDLARLRGRAGDPVGAAAAFEALLADQLRVLGPDHPDTLAARGDLAAWRGEAGDAVGAAAALQTLLADCLRVLGHDHPDTLRVRDNLGHWQAQTHPHRHWWRRARQ